MTVNGGVIEADDNAVVAGNGTKGYGGTEIDINGGTLIGHIETGGYIACGIYHPQSGMLNISQSGIDFMNGQRRRYSHPGRLGQHYRRRNYCNRHR